MKRAINLLLVASLLVGVAAAQIAGPPRRGPGGPHGRGAFGLGGFGAGTHPGKVVTNAAYSATATSTFTQTLANGNSIQRTDTGVVARDIAGRTYEQQTITAGPFSTNGPATLTFITDPVAGYSYVVNPATKTATRRALHTPQANSNAQSSTGPQHPRNANAVQEDLGTQSINGLNAQGKRTTHTIPAGSIGNAQDIKSTSETWFSPDLQVVVSSKRDDPRTGTSVYALTNISRAEPAATLFQIPADYTVQDARRGPGNWAQHR